LDPKPATLLKDARARNFNYIPPYGYVRVDLGFGGGDRTGDRAVEVRVRAKLFSKGQGEAGAVCMGTARAM